MRHPHRLAALPLAALLSINPAWGQPPAGAAPPSPCAAQLQAAQGRADLDATYNPCRLDDGAVASGTHTNNGTSARQDWQNDAAAPPHHRFADLGEQRALGATLGMAQWPGQIGWRQDAPPGWPMGMADDAAGAAAHWRAPQEVAWEQEAPPGWLGRERGAWTSFGLGGGPVTAREGGGHVGAPVPEPAAWMSLLAGLALLSAGRARPAVRR